MWKLITMTVDDGKPCKSDLAATSAPGASTGLPKLGRIQVDAPADFLILREDPTVDLSALDTIEAVVADDRVEDVKEAVKSATRTGEIGDGRVFVVPVKESRNIRTCERNVV